MTSRGSKDAAHTMPSARIDSVEILRGLAALAVAWFHLTNQYDGSWIKLSGTYGWLGVQVFFVISGFVIPLSIHRGFERFSLSDFPVYMGRRLARLEPPYVVSIAIVIVLWEAVSWAAGYPLGRPDWTYQQVFFHLGYAIPLTDYTWLQVVYWTLAFEFVFYIAAGLLFSAIAHPSVWAWATVFASTVILCASGLIPALFLLFLVGIAVFRFVALQESLPKVCAAICLAGMSLAFVGHPLQALTGVLAGLAILGSRRLTFKSNAWKSLLFLGTLSYSLYLLHAPVGGLIVQVFKEHVTGVPVAELSLSLAALLVSLVAAILLWHLVEKPAIRLSRRVGGSTP